MTERKDRKLICIICTVVLSLALSTSVFADPLTENVTAVPEDREISMSEEEQSAEEQSAEEQSAEDLSAEEQPGEQIQRTAYRKRKGSA